MSTLLEIQLDICRSLVKSDDSAAAHILTDALEPSARLSIYRNTFVGTLVNALRISFPTVHRLVGAEFFEGSARHFIDETPPRSAYLDEYGAGFPAFLSVFEPAASLPYLPGVAAVDWSVSRALHAPDVEPLEIELLSSMDPADCGRVAFSPHPAIGLVAAEYPVDEIWRAVLDQDETAMASIDLGSGPVYLLIERPLSGVSVGRIGESDWRFLGALCDGQPLEAALESVTDADASRLAEHLAHGRFVGFTLRDADPAT